MKTPINLSDYEFSGKVMPRRQISDDPDFGFPRVIEVYRHEDCFDIDMIRLQATTYFLSADKKKVVKTEPTKVGGTEWNIVKGDYTIKIDEHFQPVHNPDFDATKPVDRATNYPYQLTDAYEQFKGILLSETTPVSLTRLLYMFIDSNDANGLFD